MSFRLQPRHRLEWAILVPVAADRLEALVHSIDGPPYDDEDDDERTWGVIAGTGSHAAVIETAPGSSGTESDLAAELARETGAAVYAVGFCGYDDPDHGLPFIESYAGNERQLIWMAELFDDELPAPDTVPGPDGIPCDDPFEFTAALGCDLRRFY